MTHTPSAILRAYARKKNAFFRKGIKMPFYVPLAIHAHPHRADKDRCIAIKQTGGKGVR
jgi:hypothetical protein